MLTAGVDIGAKTIKIVIVDDGEIKAKNITMSGYNLMESNAQAWADLETHYGYNTGDMDKILVTGAGRKAIKAADEVTEAVAAARGSFALCESVRTVIEVGSEEGRAIKIDEGGKVIDFAINEKCASGTGAFIEAMASVLGVPLEELGPMSLKSTSCVAIKAQCAVFAESELVTMIHSKIPKPDMARAIHDALAGRVVSMVRWVGIEQSVMLIGGVSRNIGFVKSLGQKLECEVIVPQDPEYVSAYGTALIAAGR
ncbi:MAG: acyl-CoA dehydratase activase [Syntrophobacter sp.]